MPTLPEAIERLYEIDAPDEIIDTVIIAKKKIKELQDRIYDLELQVDRMGDEISELEYEATEYNGCMNGYAEIEYATSNFKDREMMETIQELLEKNITIEAITAHLQQLLHG